MLIVYYFIWKLRLGLKKMSTCRFISYQEALVLNNLGHFLVLKEHRSSYIWFQIFRSWESRRAKALTILESMWVLFLPISLENLQYTLKVKNVNDLFQLFHRLPVYLHTYFFQIFNFWIQVHNVESDTGLFHRKKCDIITKYTLFMCTVANSSFLMW
jgi:hypothetical protein